MTETPRRLAALLSALLAVAVCLPAIRVAAQDSAAAAAHYRAEFMDSPNRLVLDLDDTIYDGRKTPIVVGTDPLRQIRGSQYRKGIARVVLEFTRKAGYAIREEEDGLAIIIPRPVVAARAEEPVPAPAPRRTAIVGSTVVVRPGSPVGEGTAAPEATAPADAPPAVVRIEKPADTTPPAPRSAPTPPTPRSEAPRSEPARKPSAVSSPPRPQPARPLVAAAPAPRTESAVAAPAAPAAPVTAAAPPAPEKIETARPAPLIAQAPTVRARPATTPPADSVSSTTNSQRLISLDFKDADVVNLLRILAAESGRNIVVGDDVKGKMSITLRNVPWELALDTVLEARGLQKLEKDGVLRIVSLEQLAKEREGRARVEEAKLKSEAEVRTKVAEAALKEAEVAQKRLTAEVAAAEAQARGPLREETIRLVYADPDEVAKTLQGILGIPPSGNLQASTTPITGMPPIAEPPFSALYGQQPQAPAAPAASPSAEVLSKGITIRAYRPTNSLFIRHYAADVERIKKLVRENLDVPLPQVKIEARMEILDREDLFAIGVSWGGGGVLADTKHGTVVGRGFTTGQSTATGTPASGLSDNRLKLANPNLQVGQPITATTPFTPGAVIPVSSTTGLPSGGQLVNLPIASLLQGAAAAGGGGLTFGVIGSRLNVNLALEALRTQGKTTTLARPDVVTVENNKATISLGEEIPYATVSSAGTQIQFKEALLKLEVTPTVVRELDGNRIKMKVTVENNSRSTTTINLGTAGAPPVINRRKAETEVLIREGEHLVIGGVTTSVALEETRKVPFFGDIPILGWLFKQRGTQDTRRELAVFITPSVLRPIPPPAAVPPPPPAPSR
ncbi:MAG: AMIN domain-containing protein [Candidatus Rokubacteria bacterium]|nr:AMIN domain-containing protein [Candidatus Rokubacteria bacterium]